MIDLEKQIKEIMLSILKVVIEQELEIDYIGVEGKGTIPIISTGSECFRPLTFIKQDYSGNDIFILFNMRNHEYFFKNPPPIFEDQVLALIKNKKGEIILSLGKSIFGFDIAQYHQSTEIKNDELNSQFNIDLNELFEKLNLMYDEVHN